MYNTVRTCARPPQIVLRPRSVPLSPLSGATPTKAAICWRVRAPHSGSSNNNVRAHTGPIPGARCHTSSFSRHSGLARRRVAMSASSVARRSLSQVLCACMSVWRRPLVPARRCCSAVRRPTSGWRRPQRARSSCVWASGSGRGVGRMTSAKCASARASNASVVANWPVARAQSRACRGLTTTTGRPAVATATVVARSRPPVASSTIRGGWRACHRSTRVTTPPASGGTAHRSPEGRTATSNWAFATSRPTKHGTSTRGTPVGPTLQIRALGHQTTVRACGVQAVTTRAPLRSRWTQAESVCHVQGRGDGDVPTSPIKIQGCRQSGAVLC